MSEHRCPRCDVQVVDSHECTEHWEDPDYGLKGYSTTRCRVENGQMFVSELGGHDVSGIGAVMLMGSEVVEQWFMGMGADPDEIPEAER